MKPTYPCFKPGECPSHWVIELNGWGGDDFVMGRLPRDLLDYPWVKDGARCPVCESSRGVRCKTDKGGSTPLVHYARLQQCRKLASRRSGEVEDIIESRASDLRKAAWLKRQAAWLRKNKRGSKAGKRAR